MGSARLFSLSSVAWISPGLKHMRQDRGPSFASMIANPREAKRLYVLSHHGFSE